MIPPKDEVTVCFAHVAYNLQTRFAKRETGIRSLQVWNRDELDARVGEADVLVISGLWRNDLVEKATRLRFIQSIGAGTDQFGRDVLSARRNPTGERQRCQHEGGFRARDGADSGACATPSRSPRQPDQAPLARNDRRFDTPRRRAWWQDARHHRSGQYRRAAGAFGEGLRHARDRRAARSGRRQGCGRQRPRHCAI